MDREYIFFDNGFSPWLKCRSCNQFTQGIKTVPPVDENPFVCTYCGSDDIVETIARRYGTRKVLSRTWIIGSPTYLVKELIQERGKSDPVLISEETWNPVDAF